MSQRPPVIINLNGPQPVAGREWCATCAMLYLGDISASMEVQGLARRYVERAQEKGLEEIDLLLDSAMTWRKLNLAVTTAPSVYFQVPMPVCWIHLQGYDSERKPTGALVNGKEKK